MKATRWSKFCSLSRAEVWFLMEAAAAVVATDVALRLFSSKSILALFDRRPNSQRRSQGADLQRMAWLVDVADRYAPGRSSCLRQAAALAWLLRRRGVLTSLRIGVAREGDNFMAHSWLQSEQDQVFGLSDGDKYTILSSSTPQKPLGVGSEQ